MAFIKEGDKYYDPERKLHAVLFSGHREISTYSLIENGCEDAIIGQVVLSYKMRKPNFFEFLILPAHIRQILVFEFLGYVSWHSRDEPIKDYSIKESFELVQDLFRAIGAVRGGKDSDKLIYKVSEYIFFRTFKIERNLKKV